MSIPKIIHFLPLHPYGHVYNNNIMCNFAAFLCVIFFCCLFLFVLQLYLYYYTRHYNNNNKRLDYSFIQSKTIRGSIPLRGLTVCELDDEVCATDQTESRSSKMAKNKINRILLITSVGERITLEASTAEDRNSWVGALRVAALSLEINNVTSPQCIAIILLYLA